jgi:hypothetical protein
MSARARDIGVIAVAGAWWLILAVAFLGHRGDDVGRLPALSAAFIASLSRGPVWGAAGFLASLAGLLLAGLIGLAWYGLGDAIGRRLPAGPERRAAAARTAEVAELTLLGAAAWSLIWFFLGVGSLYRVPVAFACLLVGIALAVAALSRERPGLAGRGRAASRAAGGLLARYHAGAGPDRGPGPAHRQGHAPLSLRAAEGLHRGGRRGRGPHRGLLPARDRAARRLGHAARGADRHARRGGGGGCDALPLRAAADDGGLWLGPRARPRPGVGGRGVRSWWRGCPPLTTWRPAPTSTSPSPPIPRWRCARSVAGGRASTRAASPGSRWASGARSRSS